MGKEGEYELNKKKRGNEWVIDCSTYLHLHKPAKRVNT